MIIIPSSNDQITFIRIGNLIHRPTLEDMNDIREWVDDHKDVWPDCKKELPNIFGYDIKVKIFPKLDSNRKYVWLIGDNLDWYPANQDEIESWKGIFAESIGDPDFKIFVWGGLSIKRINRNLVPMI